MAMSGPSMSVVPTPTECGGYNYQYVESPPDRLVCNICQFPSQDPHLSVCCGQMFCKSCLDGAWKATVTNVCLVCQDKEFITFPNKQADCEIKSLHVMCTNKERGCEWQGELNDINNHLENSDGCQLEYVKCSNECGKVLQRRNLTSHVETECPHCKINCQYCHITGEHQFIEGEHKEQCPKLPLPCPNKCEVVNVPREDIEVHRKRCPLEMVQCEYHNVGCEERMIRKEMEKHEEKKLKDHLSLTNFKLAVATQQVEDTQQKLASTQLKLADSESKLANVMQQVEGTEQELGSTLLKLADSESKLTQQVKDIQQELASTQLKLADSESKLANVMQQVEGTEQELGSTQLKLADSESKLAQQVKDTQQDLASTQLKLADSEDRLRKQLELVTLGTNYHLANAFSQINTLMVALHHSAVTKGHASYTNNTTSVVSTAQWWAELMARAAVLKSHDQVCPVTLHIGFDGIKRLKYIQRYSDPFFSHDKGYKMCLQVDTVRSNTHLSVYLHLMKGPHDDKLTWPLRGKFEVKLLNQISDCEHYSLTIVYGDHIKDDYAAGRVKHGNKARGWGYTKFVSNEDLHKITPTCQYLKDGCIFLQVSKL
ncbi:TNF receptor-associated factor 5-like isoform X2 [Dysidea avara]|uniref:TNF receptor-associated factor 5-like isoform X2 n=1 Tax=Dysidea avara TaxID=196820 RepID=UPI00332228DE